MSARCTVLLVLAAACGLRTPEQRERDWAQSMTPKPLGPQAEAPARITLRVRALADAAYVSQNPAWDARIRALIDRASRLSQSRFGARFELVGIGPWEHPPENGLEPLLTQLQREHPPEDADLVVGFTSSLQLFSATFEDLGRASLFGRHAVLRGIDVHEQSDVIMNDLKRLSVEEKAGVVRARVEHQESVVFLHEWGHCSGAVHDRDTGFIMSPHYRDTHRAFSPASEKSIDVALEYVHKDDARADWLEVARLHLLSLPQNSLAPGVSEQLARLYAAPDAGTAPAPRPAPDERPLTDVDRQLFNIAVEKERAGRPADALATLSGLMTRYPRHPAVQDFACHLLVASKPADAASHAACALAMELAPADPRPALSLAWAKTESKDLVAARDLALEARRRAGASKREPQLQAELARALLRAGLLEAAEEEARLAEASLPAQQVLEEISRRRAPQADGCAARLDLVAKDVKAGRAAQSRTVIAALVAACPASGRAHYYAGVADEASNRRGDAVAHFEKAVASEPAVEDAWLRLAKLYGSLRMTNARVQLAQQYQRRFGRELP